MDASGGEAFLAILTSLSLLRTLPALAASICLAIPAGFAQGEALLLPPLFADGMVLQRSSATVVWGRATAGAEVVATISGRSARTRSGEDGRWSLNIDLSGLPAGPHELEIRAPGARRVVRDVAVGQVWLASGQSNMEWPVSNSIHTDSDLVPRGDVRQFRVPRRAEDAPQETGEGRWMKASPSTTGGFSGVGYFFADELSAALGEPVGILLAAWGGSPIEAWMPAGSLAADETLSKGAASVERKLAEFEGPRADYIEAFKTWIAESGRGDSRGPVATQPGGEWKKTKLPGAAGEPGVVWFRRVVEIPSHALGVPLRLEIGPVTGFEEVFLNGLPVARTRIEDFAGAGAIMIHHLDSGAAREGGNEISLRVYSPDTAPEVGHRSRSFTLAGRTLAGEWEFLQEKSFPLSGIDSAPVRPAAPPLRHTRPSRLYNGMINPLVPATIAGVLWYQGETNVTRAHQYRTAFPLMIDGWRKAWGRETMPFFWCQLPRHREPKPQPGESLWAELRESQALALRLPDTAQAVLIDGGEADNIHPGDKKTPGRRLAAIALAKLHGYDIPHNGPGFRSASFEAGQATIHFDNAPGGLVVAGGGEVLGFAVCGKDGIWKNAESRIEGSSVVVRSAEVSNPVAVRYGWADNTGANLANAAGLPAAPFRTDDFPASTRNVRYE